MPRETIATKLKTIREGAGYKQEDIAEYLNSTPQKVSSMETGRTRVDAETLASLCELYNVDANYVLGINRPAEITDKLFNEIYERPEIKGLLQAAVLSPKEDVGKIIKIIEVFQ